MGRRIVRHAIMVGPPPPWSPLSLPNLVGWWDASDTDTITETSGAVSQWDDKSGNGYHLTQSTANNQPTTGTRTQDGLDVLDFDGTDDYMTVESFDGLSGLHAFTCFAVLLRDADGGFWRAVTMNDGTNPDWTGTNRAVLMGLSGTSTTDGGTKLSSHYHNAVLTNTGASVAASTATLSVTQRDSGDWAAWTDGVAGGTATGAGATDFVSGKLRIGAALATASDFWNGWIAEVVLCSSALSDTDRETAEAYLKAKWNTP